MLRKHIILVCITHVLVFFAGVGLMYFLTPEPTVEYITEYYVPVEDPDPRVDLSDRVLYATHNYNSFVHERLLYGYYSMNLGDTMLGLNLLATEDFGPYTVIYIHGTEDYGTVRYGFYEVTDEGKLLLHFRYVENEENELVPDSFTQSWDLNISYPFIHLSYGPYTLFTAFYDDANEIIWDNVYTEDES